MSKTSANLSCLRLAFALHELTAKVAILYVHLTRGSNHGHFGQRVSGIGPFVANSYAPMLELLPRDMLTCS